MDSGKPECRDRKGKKKRPHSISKTIITRNIKSIFKDSRKDHAVFKYSSW